MGQRMIRARSQGVVKYVTTTGACFSSKPKHLLPRTLSHSKNLARHFFAFQLASSREASTSQILSVEAL